MLNTHTHTHTQDFLSMQRVGETRIRCSTIVFELRKILFPKAQKYQQMFRKPFLPHIWKYSCTSKSYPMPLDVLYQKFHRVNNDNLKTCFLFHTTYLNNRSITFFNNKNIFQFSLNISTASLFWQPSACMNTFIIIYIVHYIYLYYALFS